MKYVSLRDTIPSNSAPIINWIIIAVCIFIFLFESVLPSGETEQFFDSFGLVPALFLSHIDLQHIGTIFSSMFLHAGWGHVLGNMWFLFIFGDNVEDRLGHVSYLLFYLVVGICAAATQIFVQPGSHIAMVGASGAISGVLGAYFVFFPEARVVSVVPAGAYSRTTELPAFVFLGLWFLMQLLPGMSSLVTAQGNDVGGVAFWAHVGGFAAGWLLARIWPKNSNNNSYA